MHTIDRRHIYGIMLDTETANTHATEDGKLDMTDVLPYDFGFAVIDSHGRIYERFSYINTDIFLDEQDLMKSAYYANKILQYEKDIRNGTRKLATTYTIRKKMLELINQYECKFVVAHNMRFDLRACNNIQRWTTKSKYRYFFPRHLEIWDTLQMARDIMRNKPTFKAFCQEHGYMTKNNQCRLTAEVLYRYITHNLDFEEAHTGLEDVEIEATILNYCVRQHKKMRKALFKQSLRNKKI